MCSNVSTAENCCAVISAKGGVYGKSKVWGRTVLFQIRIPFPYLINVLTMLFTIHLATNWINLTVRFHGKYKILRVTPTFWTAVLVTKCVQIQVFPRCWGSKFYKSGYKLDTDKNPWKYCLVQENMKSVGQKINKRCHVDVYDLRLLKLVKSQFSSTLCTKNEISRRSENIDFIYLLVYLIRTVHAHEHT